MTGCEGELNVIHSWRAGHFSPPLASGRVTSRVLIEVPMPHDTSQSPHSAQPETWQSITDVCVRNWSIYTKYNRVKNSCHNVLNH